jgi:2-methylcitrate dehydratase PrpD
MTITEQLVDWAWRLDLTDVPAEVQHSATRHLLDGTGTAIAGYRRRTVPYAVAVAERTPIPSESTVIGLGRKLPAAQTAFANGTLIHALDFDDTHAGGLVHATATVLPAAFAVGERSAATGDSVLAAAIAGLETVTRIGRAVPHGFHNRGFHATSVCGVFAAALVASRLGGLSEDQAVNALGIAGSQASGSLEFLSDGSSTKQLHPGWSALAGITAADLAAAGATGPATILEGGSGLYRSYTGQPVDESAVLGGLGHDWETTSITIKPYPVCQLSHASLDALNSLREQIEDTGHIETIEFRVPEESVPVVCEPRSTKLDPRTAYEAKFSLAWDAAVLLVDGRIGVSTFDDLNRPEVRSLAERVEYRSYRSETVPAAAPGMVIVRLQDGRQLEIEIPASRGGPDNPLPDADLRAKFIENCGPHMSDPDTIAGLILDLGNVGDLSDLLASTTVQEDH